MTAATAQLSAVNLALARLGEGQVATLDLDATSTAAKKILPFLDSTRDMVLGRHGWLCAQAFVARSESGEPGNFRYAYIHHLPGDALRAWEIDDKTVRWQRGTRALAGAERQVIYASADLIDIVYIRRVGWDGIPAHLTRPIAWELAALGAVAIQGEQQLARVIREEFKTELAAAVTLDGTEAGGQPELLQGTMRAARRVC